jgi:hypothetical protein
MLPRQTHLDSSSSGSRLLRFSLVVLVLVIVLVIEEMNSHNHKRRFCGKHDGRDGNAKEARKNHKNLGLDAFALDTLAPN